MDSERETLARAAAETGSGQNPAFDRVVLACLRRGSDPVVAVIRTLIQTVLTARQPGPTIDA